jgi:UDP-glucuronate 4-epimerase
MKILLTGAAGFIGSHMSNALEADGHVVLGIDNFSDYYSVDYKKARMGQLRKESEPTRNVDISDLGQLQGVFSEFKPDYVVHLAAQAGVRLNFIDSQIYVNSNVLGFYNVIRCAEEFRSEGVMFASSSSVYGDSSPTPYKENSLSLRPKSIYGVSKLANEMFAEIQARNSKLKFRGLRFFTVYGPWGRPDMAYFRIVAAALGKSKFSLFGDGRVKRDFTFIDDVVNTSVKLLKDLTERNPGFSDVVNIGGSRPLDMNYLIGLIERFTESRFDIQIEPANASDSLITMADRTYLTSLIGEQSFTDLEDGVKQLVTWASQENIRNAIGIWIQGSK